MTATAYETLGDAIKAIRTARGISQGELASRAGLSQSMISMIEARKRGWRPTRVVVRALAQGLGVKERELLAAAEMDEYEEVTPVLTISDAIDADPYLTTREKNAFIQMYRAVTWGRR